MAAQNKNLKDEVESLRQEVARYKAWFRAIDEHAKFDFWFKDANSNYDYVNPHFAKNMGRDKYILEDTPLEEIFEGDRYQRVRTLDQQVMSEEYLNRVIPCDASGTMEMHEEHRFVVKDEDGEAIGLGCFAFEVTEKSLAEETLHQAEKLANLCSWRWSAQTNALISCSEQLAEFLGVSITEAFEVFPKRADTLVHDADKALFKPVQDRINGDVNGSYEIEYRLRRPDGTLIYVHEKAEPFSASNGANEYLGVMKDITQQKLAEQALRTANENLEDEVAKRTAELQTTKDIAVKSNETKTLFLASMSHELRTPLNAIIGFSDLMAQETLGPVGNPEYIELSQHILDNGETLLSMVEDVLVVAGTRKESRETLEFEDKDLTALIDAALDSVKSDCKARNIGVIWAKPEQNYKLDCNAQRITRVFHAVLSNAIKFNRQDGFIKIKVTQTPNTHPNKGVFIDITDSGIGIAETDLKDIMSPFAQADNSYTRAYEGAGLGLAVAQHWVKLHDGSISIASKIDQGTIVRIFLPALAQTNTTLDDMADNVAVKLSA